MKSQDISVPQVAGKTSVIEQSTTSLKESSFSNLSKVAWCVSALTFSTNTIRAKEVSLAWDPNPETNITSYTIHNGAQSGTYTNQINVGNNVTSTINNLDSAKTYHFAVQATNQKGERSEYSNELIYVTNNQFNATSNSLGTLTLSWKNPDDLPNSTNTRIYFSKKLGESTKMLTAQPEVERLSISGLDVGQLYYVTTQQIDPISKTTSSLAPVTSVIIRWNGTEQQENVVSQNTAITSTQQFATNIPAILNLHNKIEVTSVNPNLMRLVITGIPGERVLLQKTDHLLNVPFKTIVGIQIPSTGKLTYLDPKTTANGFYRIVGEGVPGVDK